MRYFSKDFSGEKINLHEHAECMKKENPIWPLPPKVGVVIQTDQIAEKDEKESNQSYHVWPIDKFENLDFKNFFLRINYK